MTNIHSILKSRNITLPTNVCLVKAMVFPVVMCVCEHCTIKKAECQRIDAFGLWHWRRLLRVPWTSRSSNQSILKEISHEYSLGGLMLNTPILWPPDLKSWLFWKDLDAGKGWRQEEKGTAEDEMDGWHHQLSGHESEYTLGVGAGQGGLALCSTWVAELDMTEQQNWMDCFNRYHDCSKSNSNWGSLNMYISKRHLPWRSTINMSCFIPIL